MIFADYHTHTNYSHGKGTPEANVLAAIAAGLRRVCISEHAGGHVLYGVRGEKLERLRRETERLASRYANDIEVLFGLECNVTGFGRCDAPRDTSMFDVLLLGFHKGVWPSDGYMVSRMLEAARMGAPDPARTAESLLIAAEKHKIGMLSHPSLYVRADIDALSKGAAELGVLLEISGSRDTLSVAELRLAAKNGARFVINSDAHRPSDVGTTGNAEALAAAAGVTGSVINIASALQ